MECKLGPISSLWPGSLSVKWGLKHSCVAPGIQWALITHVRHLAPSLVHVKCSAVVGAADGTAILLHVSTIKGCWWGEGRGLTGFLCLCLGQASSATAKQTGKLTEFMCNLAWDFPVKEGFKVFKEMLATKPLMGSHHSWSRPQSLLRTPDTRSYVTSTDSSPARASKGALFFSPEDLSPQVRELYQQLKEFMAQHVYPDELELQRH